MRGFVFSAAAVILCISGVSAANAQDSTRVEELSESIVLGVRARKNAPYAVANVSKDDLEDFTSTGRELPMLFSRTPGVLGWGENGLGTGTAHLRIRGAGDSRINVTLDGVPLNSPEDQCVFWANMNSYGALLGSAQIQRGVGTSTNGDGAFGGTVSLASKAPSYVPKGEVRMGYGSYNTMNVGGFLTTGLLWNHLVTDMSYYQTTTDGFMHGTAGRSGNFYGGVSWIGNDYMIRYYNILNFEHTGQAWNGLTAGNDDASLMGDGIRSYKDLYEQGLGQYNSLYERLVFDYDNWEFPKDAQGNFMTERYRMRDGTLWDRTVDHFTQDHHILSFSGRLGDRLKGTAALHYTAGNGYYEEFRPDNKLKKFGLVSADISRTDFVRKKGLDQQTYGLVAGLDYKGESLELTGGLSLQNFKGVHFGYLTYIADEALDKQVRGGKDYQYYDSDAFKGDYSAFVKAVWHLGAHWDAFGDLQYRHVDYRTDGINDKFYKNADGTYRNQVLDVDEHYNFFNPKGGVSYVAGPHKAYASVAVSHREPERNNFTDNGGYPAPKPESLVDWEAGYQYAGNALRLGANFYYMDYTDQFVQTGALSDIGEALTANIKDSYRLGVELSAGADVTRWLSLEANAALSRNRILDFDEWVEDWEDDAGRTVHYDNSTLAFSPSAILNGFIDVHAGAFKAVWHTGYVSRQYLDNTANGDRSLPGYSVSDLNLSYTLKFPRILNEVVFGINLGNVFNAHYAAGGWVYSAVSESYGYTLDNRYYQIGFMPMAGFTATGSLTVRF